MVRGLRKCFPPGHPIFAERQGQPRYTNAGLWLDKYLAEQESENDPRVVNRGEKEKSSKARHVAQVSHMPEPPIYKEFYSRWKAELEASDVRSHKAKVQGRMVVGLGDESVLETSITLHHTYGLPYIPGSALKGLAASYARRYFAEQWKQEMEPWKEQKLEEERKNGKPQRQRSDTEWNASLRKELKKYSQTYQQYCFIFGDTDEPGAIVFLDALYEPESGDDKRALHPDIITVHHQQYYQGTEDAPADWDSPIPVPLLSATGTYLIALAAPDLPAGDQREQWINATFDLLELALKHQGIGAKTSSGYGRMKFLSEEEKVDSKVVTGQKEEKTNPEVIAVQQASKELERMSPGGVNSGIQSHYQRWRKLTSDEARIVLGQTIISVIEKSGSKQRQSAKKEYQEIVEFLKMRGD